MADTADTYNLQRFVDAQNGGNTYQRAADELGAETKTSEAGVDPTGWEAALVDTAANEEFDIMVVGTFQMMDSLEKIAPQ